MRMEGEMKRGLTFLQKINKNNRRIDVSEAGRLRGAEAEKVKGTMGSHSTNYRSAGHRRFWIICGLLGDGNERDRVGAIRERENISLDFSWKGPGIER